MLHAQVAAVALVALALGAVGCSNGAAPSEGTGGGSSGNTGSDAAGNSGTANASGGSQLSGTAGKGGGANPNGGTSAAGEASGGTAPTAGTGGQAGNGSSGAPGVVAWETKTLSTQNVAEGADVGDIDGDGVLDLVAGPIWYKGPAFAQGGTLFANPPTFTMNQYSTFFLTFVDDLNGDTRPDVIAVGDAGGGNGSGTPNAFWYQNPGPSNLAQAWTKTPIYGELVANESPAYLDLLGDAKKELVFMTDSKLGYAARAASATTAWTFTAVSGSTTFNTPYVHGLGAGDIDGDGLTDLVERSAWWRQVAGANWERHAFDFAMGADKAKYQNWGGAQMHVYDIDGDGDNDVVTALAAHQYGLSWFERQGTGSALTFVAHPILPASAAGSISQLHSLAVADVNGDGLSDIVVGKRYYAHPSTNPDPGTTDPPVLAWFELSRGATGASFTQHVIHQDSGAGCNFVARDVNGDGKVDVFTTNKRGTFLHLQR